MHNDPIYLLEPAADSAPFQISLDFHGSFMRCALGRATEKSCKERVI